MFKFRKLLRIVNTHGAKIIKNQNPLTCFARLFYNHNIYQISGRRLFDQVARDGKNMLTFEKRPLVAELSILRGNVGEYQTDPPTCRRNLCSYSGYQKKGAAGPHGTSAI